MNKSRKQLIVESIEKMDINMLHVLLDDHITYHRATKEVFLEKIADIFIDFKDNGDTFLVAHPGCSQPCECTNNVEGAGYSFLGNVSSYSLDLIFMESAGEVTNITQSCIFQTYDPSIQSLRSKNINIFHNESARFNPSIEYLIKNQKWIAAYEEIIHHPDPILDKEIYGPWLHKHEKLIDKIGIDMFLYSEYDKFKDIYYTLDFLYEFLPESENAKESFEAYERIDKTNEKQILRWLTKYEKLGHKLLKFIYDDIDMEFPENTPYFEEKNLKIATADFEFIIKFREPFWKLYWEMLEKYSIYNKEESLMYSNINPNYYHLTYHLTQGGIDYL